MKKLLTLLALSVTACGGGSTTTEGFSSGFPKSLSVQSLSLSDRRILCQRMNSYSASLSQEPGVCAMYGINDASTLIDDVNGVDGLVNAEELQRTCLVTESQCIANSQVTENINCEALQTPVTNCDAKIETIEQCLFDIASAVKSSGEETSCDSVTVKYVREKSSRFFERVFGAFRSRSCSVILERCPGVLNLDE